MNFKIPSKAKKKNLLDSIEFMKDMICKSESLLTDDEFALLLYNSRYVYNEVSNLNNK